jgi:hypothetical protein
MSIASATRALARLAWRELRRRRGSLLVIALVALPVAALTVAALVALPVAALTVAAVVAASSDGSPQDQRRSVFGGADIVVQFAHEDAADDDSVAADVRQLPAGSRVLRVHERRGLVPGVRGSDVFVEASDLPLQDPFTAGMTQLLRGRAPHGPTEVGASANVLRDLGLRLGDTLVSRRLGLRARITAEVADPGDLASSRIFSGASLPLSARHRTDVRLLVALAPGASASAAATLRGPPTAR